ncbi:SWI/SNF nucleosome remodeling complex component [Orchesella cincta]|uniref:SWI/SNF nucleosome remodeling complex component n=1 Tax=Orchesella cincta TaxID=48709 RepID=A0A1D2MF93_ORCCI|nr:SWI/SNF nucleosome remodeling complex component [Orchesella cincta]
MFSYNLVHPIHHRYNSLRDVAAVVYGTPSDDKPIINGYLKTLTRNGISEVVSMHQRIVLPVFGNNKVERTFTLQTDNPKQNTVTLTFTGLPVPATPTVGSQKLLSEDELDNVIPYLCEWGDCNSRFLEKKQLRWHFYQTHCPKNGFTEKLSCLWRGKHSSSSPMSCQSPRSIFSLMSHLEEHYSDTALEAALHKRKNKMATSVAVPGVNLVQEALKQVSATQMETMPEKEDDLTKSIRLTAALALRNLAKDSFEAKRSLKHHESHFVEVAMRGLECSGAISQLLYYLNE